MKRDDIAGMIYDVLADTPDGLTIYDIAEEIDLPVYSCRNAMRNARLALAEGQDTLFVVAEPQGPREPWLYRLVDGKTLVDTARVAIAKYST